MAKFCINCGNEISEGAKVCANCGTPVDGAAPVTAQAQPTVVVNNTVQPKQSNGMAVAGFVISLVSLCCCGSLNWLSLIFSIIGLVKSKDVNGSGKGLAIAGIIISCIGVIIFLIFMLTGIFAGALDSYTTASTYGY